MKTTMLLVNQNPEPSCNIANEWHHHAADCLHQSVYNHETLNKQFSFCCLLTMLFTILKLTINYQFTIC